MSNQKTEKIIILGHSGSGKDHLRKGLMDCGLKYFPKFTTRPKRKNEIHGEDYYFIDYDLYVEFYNEGKIKTSQSFEINGVNWYYGITNENWNKNQIFVMTPHELNQIPEEELSVCFVVYLNIPEEVRKERLLERMDNNDSIDRRILADKDDFSGFSKYDLSITDPEFEAEWIYDLMY